MATWPINLQQVADYNYTESWDDGTIRSQPEEGPLMTRRRYTKIRKFSKLSIWVSKEQYSVFYNFYNITIGGGSLTFTWSDPITNSPATMLFMKPPVISVVGPLTFKIDCELQVAQ